MGVIIAVVNNKGGVGKTSITANLGHALANRNQRVLVVDIDGQANLTEIMIPNQEFESCLFDLIRKKTVHPKDCIYRTPYKNLWCIPNVEEVNTLEPKMVRREDRGYLILRNKLRDYAKSEFDITLIDCPPNLGLFVMQAMNCADCVIIPVNASSRWAVKGLDRTIKAIKDLQSTINPDLRFLRVLINKVDRRTAVSKMMIETIKSCHDKIFRTTIGQNTAIEQAELAAKTVIRFSSQCTGTKHFRALADELIKILKKIGGM